MGFDHFSCFTYLFIGCICYYFGSEQFLHSRMHSSLARHTFSVT